MGKVLFGYPPLTNLQDTTFNPCIVFNFDLVAYMESAGQHCAGQGQSDLGQHSYILNTASFSLRSTLFSALPLFLHAFEKAIFASVVWTDNILFILKLYKWLNMVKCG